MKLLQTRASTCFLLLALLFVSQAKDFDDENAKTMMQSHPALFISLPSAAPPPLSPEDNDKDRHKDKEEKPSRRARQTLTITETRGASYILPPLSSPPPSAAAAGVIGSISLSSKTGTPSTQFTSDSDFQTAVLNSTDTIRRAHNASALSWNETLVSAAKGRTESCRWQRDQVCTSIATFRKLAILTTCERAVRSER